MYSKFDVTIGSYFYGDKINKHLPIGQEIYSKCKDNVKNTLEKYILPNGSLDGDMMKEEWFKLKNYDIFLSHSHKDIDKVKAFAGWLNYTFGLTCFIDSCVWGYCDDLLKRIDDKYCKNKTGDTYNYDRRNYSTSHVHMMMSTALTEMIDLSECIMFFNTPNSVSVVDDLDYIKNRKNKHGNVRVSISPWIYHELSMSLYIEQKNPNRFTQTAIALMEHSEIREKEELQIQYKVSPFLEKMHKLSDKELELWSNQYCSRKNEHPLDVLYEQYVKA